MVADVEGAGLPAGPRGPAGTAPVIPAQRSDSPALPRAAAAAEPVLRRRAYLPVTAKFALAALGATAWALLSVWLSLPWERTLSGRIGTTAAVVLIALIAYIPGWLVAFLAVSLVLDRQPPLRMTRPDDPVTIIIAARNESAGIAQTLRNVAIQDHAGPVHVILADNGSTDDTVVRARAAAVSLELPLRVVHEARPGKTHALNTALAATSTELVITLDADTLLHRSAVRHLVARLRSSPADVRSVAGSVLVRNSRRSVWTRMQEWDYFLGIASIKRMQGLYQGTLVAQGAFSLYRTDAVRAVGGWPDAIGEDIVLTWQLLREGARVYFEPLAVAFTDAPTTVRHFARQRARWARGMIEGIRTVQPWRQPRLMAATLTGLDVFIPLLDLAYTFVWLPGLVLACTGRFWVVGPYTAAVLPLTLLVNWILYRYQRTAVFDPLGLRVRRNRLGLLGFVLCYQMLMSPVAVYGYAQELAHARRRWK